MAGATLTTHIERENSLSAAASSPSFSTSTFSHRSSFIDEPIEPIPLVLSVTATANFQTYSLAGPSQEAHRWARANKLGPDDGLLSALLEALRMLTPTRTRKLLAAQRTYQSAVWSIKNPGSIRPADFKPLPRQLEVTIRTGSRDLIEAATFLRRQRFDRVPMGIESELWCDLNRFAVTWVKLHSQTAQIRALQRWAALECRPGWAATRDEETHQAYRTRVASYDAINHESRAEYDQDTSADEHEGAVA